MSKAWILCCAVVGVGLLSACDDGNNSNGEIVLQDTLLTGHMDWARSSLPFENATQRGRFHWFTLSDPILLSELDPVAFDAGAEETEYRVLQCLYDPWAVIDSVDVVQIDPDSYGSMTTRNGVTNFLTNFATQVEFLMLVDTLASQGALVLDMGQFSEDVIPNGFLDTEDFNYDGMLTTFEDVGLDQMSGRDLDWPIPVEVANWTGTEEQMIVQLGDIYDFEDVDGDFSRGVNDPWSFDDYLRAPDDGGWSIRDTNPHGTEGNSRDSDQIIPDTEDLNGNNTVDLDEGYYRYTMPLNPIALPAGSQYTWAITAIPNSPWYRVRVNLLDSHREVHGIPDSFRPVRMRISLTGFSGPVALRFTGFRFTAP